jgi:tRNA dimethylallyltransferase
MQKSPLRIIVGTTASGKEQLALAVAKKIGGEIISVDSMKVYTGLDIATAKASLPDRRDVPHHCLDLVAPTETFSAADFVAAADRAIADITARGKVPVLSGGTAFYYKALLDGLFEGPGADPAIRAEIEEKAALEGTPALHAELSSLDPAAALKIHPSDLRRLVRALEVIRLTGDGISSRQKEWAGFHSGNTDYAAEPPPFFANPRHDFVMARIVRSRDDVHSRIRARVARMEKEGLRDEVEYVFANRESMSRTPLQAVGYKEFFPYFEGTAKWEEAIERLCLNTNKLVRSQDTWFRKFPAALVEAGDEDADALAERLLADSFGA